MHDPPKRDKPLVMMAVTLTALQTFSILCEHGRTVLAGEKSQLLRRVKEMSILLNGFVHMSLVAVLGIITLVAAIAFATHPGERKLGFIRPLSIATTFSILSAICGGMGATFLRVSSVVETGEPGGLHQAMISLELDRGEGKPESLPSPTSATWGYAG